MKFYVSASLEWNGGPWSWCYFLKLNQKSGAQRLNFSLKLAACVVNAAEFLKFYLFEQILNIVDRTYPSKLNKAIQIESEWELKLL